MNFNFDVLTPAYEDTHYPENLYLPPYHPMPMMREAKFSSSMAAPEFVGGDSRMTIQISGTIETH